MPYLVQAKKREGYPEFRRSGFTFSSEYPLLLTEEQITDAIRSEPNLLVVKTTGDEDAETPTPEMLENAQRQAELREAALAYRQALQQDAFTGIPFPAATGEEVTPEPQDDNANTEEAVPPTQDPHPPVQTLESPLPEDFPARAALVEAGLDTVEGVTAATDETLRGIAGIGASTLTKIREALSPPTE